MTRIHVSPTQARPALDLGDGVKLNYQKLDALALIAGLAKKGGD